MILNIRRHLRGHSYRFVVIIATIGIIISFALPPVIKQMGRDAEWVISVNGAEISEKIFRYRVSQQQEFLVNFRQQYGPYADMLLESMGVGRDPQQLAFNILVKESLLLQSANALGIHVHPQEFGEKLTNPQFVQQDLAGIIPPYFVAQDGSFNEKVLRRYLQRIGVTVGQFETSVFDAISRRMVSQLAFTTAHIPLFDIRQKYIADFVPKKFTIATFSLDTFIKKAKEESISNDQIQEFFDIHNSRSGRYVVPEKRSGIMWTFDPASYGFKISEKEIETYYEDHKSKDYVAEPTKIQVRRIVLRVSDESRVQEVEQRAYEIYQKVTQGASFEAVAKEVSEDTATAKHGGLVPAFSRGEQNPALERVAFLLKDDGEISPVFRSNDGFEIIQRVSKKMRIFKPLSSVSGAIKTQLMKDRFRHQFMVDMKLLVDKRGDLDDHLASFVAQQSGKKKNISLMSNDESQLAHALFGINTVKGLEFYIDGDYGVAVQLLSIEPKYTPALADLKSIVLNDMYEDRALQQLKQDLASLVESKADSESLQKAGAKLEKTGWITAESSKELKELEGRGISSKKILQLETEGSAFYEISDRKGFVITLSEKGEFDAEKFAIESPKIRRALEAERAAIVLEGFIASLYRTATIKTNESVLNLYQEYSI